MDLDDKLSIKSAKVSPKKYMDYTYEKEAGYAEWESSASLKSHKRTTYTVKFLVDACATVGSTLDIYPYTYLVDDDCEVDFDPISVSRYNRCFEFDNDR